MLSCIKSKNVHKKTKIDILGNLPQETVHNICLYLTGDDICEIWNSSGRWRHQIINESFWKRKCEIDNFQPIEKSKETVASKKLTDQFGYWQGTYFYNHALHNNWKYDIYEEITVEVTLNTVPPNHYVHYFDDEILAIRVTPYKKLHIINSSTGKVTHTFRINAFEGGNFNKFIVKKHNDLLIYVSTTSSSFCNMYVWNIRTNELIMNKRICEWLKGETIQFHKNLIGFVCKNTQKYFCLLNMDTQGLKHVADDVKKFYFYKKWAVLFLTTGSVSILNLDDDTLVELISPENHRNLDMLLKDQYLIIFCQNWKMTTWNVETLEKIITFNVFDFIPKMKNYNKIDNFMLLDDNKIGYRINRNSKFYIWDFLTGTYLFTVGPPTAISEVKVGNHLVFTTNKENFFIKYGVEIWCLKSGKQIRKFEMFYNTINLSNRLTETRIISYRENGNIFIWDYDKKISFHS